MKKKLLSMICILALVFTSVVPVSAMEVQTGGAPVPVTVNQLHKNPVYQDVIDEKALRTELAEASQYAVQPLDDITYYSDIEEIAVILRQAMVNRQESVTIGYAGGDYTQEKHDQILDLALSETDSPKEGDYLSFQYGGCGADGGGYVQNGVYYLTMVYSISYYTTAEQEAAVDAEVERVLDELGITWYMDDYQKVCKIYDYICSHVTYDYTNLENKEYKLKYTAYAALFNGTAVCQGYANLFYRMAKEAGLSPRIVRGWQTSTKGGHAWNIVKLGDWYYNLDATWDSAYVEACLPYAYYLKGWNTFDDHTFDEAYTTESFLAEYPMSTEAYVPGSGQDTSKDISQAEARLSQDTFVYNGDKHMPDVIIDGLEYGVDYDVTYLNNLNTGQATAVVHGMGNFCGEIMLPFTIKKASISNVKVSLDQEAYHYVGQPVKPLVNVGALVEGKDFELSYSNNNGVGTGVISLTGKGNYTGTCTIVFEILECAHQWDDGKVTLEPNCTREGIRTYSCTICQGEKTETISVNDSHNMSGWVIEREASCSEPGLQAKVCENGCGHREEETLPMNGRHSFTNYVSDGNATCEADGTKTAKCDNCTETDTVADTGSVKGHTEKKEIAKASRTSDGIILTKCSACGDTLKEEVIPAIDTVVLSYEQKVYTEKNIAAPQLTATDREGNRIISYDVTGLTGKTAVGRYKVTVNFKGNYEGSTDLYFTIVPKKVSSVSVNLNSADQKNGYNDIKATWKKSTGATGYLVYYKKASASKWSSPVATTKTSYTKKNLAAGTKYTFKVVPYYKESGKTTKYYDTTQYKSASTTTLKKVTGVKVVKSGTKAKVSWTNINGETGYQISKMTKKSATQKTPTTVKSATAKSKLITATKGKTYYYKVRAYKVVDGKKVYGPWSAPKAFKRK